MKYECCSPPLIYEGEHAKQQTYTSIHTHRDRHRHTERVNCRVCASNTLYIHVRRRIQRKRNKQTGAIQTSNDWNSYMFELYDIIGLTL